MARSLRHPLVLVVEDDQVSQKLACLIIDSLGLPHCAAGDGQQAVTAYQEKAPTLILMDIMMPIMDGFQASRKIRIIEFGRQLHTPIIACTALEQSRVQEQCLASGIDDYLGKPYSKAQLVEKVESWLNIRAEVKPPPR